MNLTVIDNRAPLIVANVVTVLRELTYNGQKVFREIIVADDVDSFGRIEDVQRKPVAGIVYTVPDVGPGSDGDEQATYRLSFKVLLRFRMERAPGKGEGEAVAEMNRLHQLIRDALWADRSRGGKAAFILWRKAPLNGTDLDGAPTMVAKYSNQLLYMAALPFAAGWFKAR